MAVASPQVELLISLFFSEDDVNFSYVSYISTSGITTLHTQDIFLEKIKNHANNLIGDHICEEQFRANEGLTILTGAYVLQTLSLNGR